METTSIAQLKAHLSSYLRRVREGNAVLITDRGTPVARLQPVSAAGERRRSLAAAGLLEPGRGRVRKSLLELPASGEGGLGLVETLLAEREEGR